MAFDRSSLTASEVGQILVATSSTRRLEGRSKVLALDRIATPTLNMFRAMKGARSRPIQGGFKTTVKGERGGVLQAYSGRDRLTFDSFETMFDLEWSMGYNHMGDEWVHQQLKESGVDIVPDNQGGSLPKVAADTFEVVVNLAEEKAEDLENNYVQALNKTFWRSNSSDTKQFGGIDALLPVTSNATGTTGGKSRSNPLLRHQLVTAAATIDNIELTISKMVRAANKRNGADNSRIDYAVCGEALFDKLKDLYLGTSTRQGKIERNWMNDQVSKMQARIGVGIPDDTMYIPGVGLLVLEPVFEDLDALDAPAIPWSNRLYLFNTSHVGFKAAKGMDGLLRVNPTPDDQMITRVSMFGDYTLLTDKPNAQAVLYI